LLAGLALGAPSSGCANSHVIPRPFQLDRLNRSLHGHVVDYTHNHGADRRIWSPALGEKRDLYVYLPPGYCPHKRYPLILVLHGFLQDETVFTESVIRPLDRAMARGDLPPAILAAPDGSFRGVANRLSPGTFFLNTQAGNFEDYLVEDVWNFLTARYPVRPEREAHVLLGVSMGGGAAFHMAIKYKERFGVAVGVFPPLNSRWISCRGRYRDKFDPDCWGWRTDFSRGREVVGSFYHGLLKVRLRRFIHPLYGRNNPDILPLIIQDNPVEMLALYDVRPGEIEMYVAYAGRDEFNLDAQAESFLFVARQRGLDVGVGYEPEGRHNEKTALKLLPGVLAWLAPRLVPYSPH
jgi:pimeloyl-ACP methyl ester carboxylesterase